MKPDFTFRLIRNEVKLALKELETFLNTFLEESLGSDDAFLCLYRDEIICRLEKSRAIPVDSKGAEDSKSEFRDMANELIEKLSREPFELKCELASVWRNGFTLEIMK
jgi:hypothetical protein